MFLMVTTSVSSRRSGRREKIRVALSATAISWRYTLVVVPKQRNKEI